MTEHVRYLYDAATLRRLRRDGRITPTEFTQRMSALVHTTAGVDALDADLERHFTEAEAVANEEVQP